MDGSAKDFQQLKHAIKPYCMMFMEIKEKKKLLPITMFQHRKEKSKQIRKHCFFGGVGGQLFPHICFLLGLGT
jgi:hypothetical protein